MVYLNIMSFILRINLIYRHIYRDFRMRFLQEGRNNTVISRGEVVLLGTHPKIGCIISIIG